MPTTILHKESLIPGRTSKLVLDAPQIAATAKPGHFVKRFPKATAFLTSPARSGKPRISSRATA